MNTTPIFYTTDNCRTPIFGCLLEKGDLLKEGDVYDSTSGFWSPCPCPGTKIQSGSVAVWIRPEGKK